MFDHERGERLEREVRELAERVDTIEGRQMTDQAEIDAITKQVGEIGAGLATLNTDVQTANATLQAEITSLANANPTLDLSGLQNAVAAQVAAVAPLDEAVKALDQLKPQPAAPTAPTKSVYTHNGEGAIDSTVWTASGFETVPAEGGTAQPLYYFSGDNAAGETNGASAEWVPYTGATQPVPAGA